MLSIPVSNNTDLATSMTFGFQKPIVSHFSLQFTKTVSRETLFSYMFLMVCVQHSSHRGIQNYTTNISLNEILPHLFMY